MAEQSRDSLTGMLLALGKESSHELAKNSQLVYCAIGDV